MNLPLILATYLVSSLILSGFHLWVILLLKVLSKVVSELFKITDEEFEYSNFTSEERKAMWSLRDAKQIVVIKTK